MKKHDSAATSAIRDTDSFRALEHLKTTSARRRRVPNEELLCSIDPFVRDEGKIFSSKAYRRLGRKAQVVTRALNPHIRDRQSHTGEVVACVVRISEVRGLNTNLTRAIALGHDIGHVPFGHVGEQYLSDRIGRSFKHETMGVVIAQHIERHGYGLNLTHEVLCGMHEHSGGSSFQKMTECTTPESSVVRLGDKVAYVFADLNDFQRIGFPIPKEVSDLALSFGSNQRQREATVVNAICRESAERGAVSFSDSDEAVKFGRLRELMYALYPRVTAQDPRHVLDHVFKFLEMAQIVHPVVAFSVMTDDDIVYLNEQPMLNAFHLRNTAVGEMVDFLQEQVIDCTNPDLDW